MAEYALLFRPTLATFLALDMNDVAVKRYRRFASCSLQNEITIL